MAIPVEVYNVALASHLSLLGGHEAVLNNVASYLHCFDGYVINTKAITVDVF